MGRFGLLVTAYGGLSAFYYYASDTIWEQIRSVLPDFAVGVLFAFMGPIVAMDFIQPVSFLPYVLQSVIAVGLFYLYGQSLKARYIAALAALWIFSLQAHAYIMGTLSGSPNPVSCGEACQAFMQFIF